MNYIKYIFKKYNRYKWHTCRKTIICWEKKIEKYAETEVTGQNKWKDPLQKKVAN